MTLVSKLAVHNMRAHDSFVIKLSPSVTVITGANGSGKTSLIEALYVALRGSSFKGSDKEILKQTTDWWRIDVGFDDTSSRSVKFDPAKTSGKKQFVVNHKTSYRLSEKDKLPVVLFEPEDLRLLHGSPARRRLFIDRFIAQIDPHYALALRRYERALKQRNTLLKLDGSADDLFAWNISLSDYGSYIMERRVQFIEQINKSLNDEYQTIAKNNDAVSIHYSHTVIGDQKTRLLGELEQHMSRDRVLGYTSVGPHRHDVSFVFNGASALSVVSRGEARTIVLALKFIESDMVANLTGINPLMLLDDVFSELDEDRQLALTKLMGKQIVITSTSISGYEDEYVYRLPAK